MLLRNSAASVYVDLLPFSSEICNVDEEQVVPVFVFYIVCVWGGTSKRFMPDIIPFVSLLDSASARGHHFLELALRGQYFSAGNEKAPPRQIARPGSPSG